MYFGKLLVFFKHSFQGFEKFIVFVKSLTVLVEKTQNFKSKGWSARYIRYSVLVT